MKNIGEIISVPGWSHEIKNSGKQKAIILLWSNEIYDNKILTPIINQYEKTNNCCWHKT